MRSDYRASAAAIVAAAMLLAACSRSGAPDDARSLPPALSAVMPAEQALAGANIPTLDPSTLADAEIDKVIGAQPHCTFRYTNAGRPVLAASLKADGAPAAGVVKLNGNLVLLQAERGAAPSGIRAIALAAPPVRLLLQWPETAEPNPAQRVEAEMVFEVGQRLKVGYSGFVSCTSASPASSAEGRAQEILRV